MNPVSELESALAKLRELERRRADVGTVDLTSSGLNSLAQKLSENRKRRNAVRLKLSATIGRFCLLTSAAFCRRIANNLRLPGVVLSVIVALTAFFISLFFGSKSFAICIGVPATVGLLVFSLFWFCRKGDVRLAIDEHYEQIKKLARDAARLKIESSELKTRCRAIHEQLTSQREYESQKILCSRLQEVQADHCHSLSRVSWREMAGVQFEGFLAEVLRNHGYSVDTTRTTGDQGVDLVAQKNGRRIAIQAKGYQGSVGNDAVQQAYTGMSYYECHSCVVITNSYFTRSAQELAQKVGCSLVGGAEMNDLIFGGIFI